MGQAKMEWNLQVGPRSISMGSSSLAHQTPDTWRWCITWGQCYDFVIIFAEKVGEKIDNFVSNYSIATFFRKKLT
jgi:surface antigen